MSGGRGIDVEGARIVITGGGSGIGEATALRAAASGAAVVVVDIDGAAAARVAEACTALGAPPAVARVCDVADAGAVHELAAQVEREDGAVDVLVNNAGVGIVGPFLDTTLEDWQWLRSINLDGVAHGCYAFGPAMVARGRGQVVNIASGAAYIPNRHMAAYCATKAAVVSLSQCLRADWRPHGVGVSVVCPGVIATPIATATRYRGRMVPRRARAEKALGMGHSPDLVAKAVLDCARRDRDVVPVGFESTLAYKLLRGAPQPIQSLVARAEL
ncbi:SDR family NAD(P)-dependent oxidoreductase [Paraconexibacter antarcticus]|uniref:SDR family NAD(P)-dependent oxidoreductase n=1 Tax=Paraconexibacter antarcticus TaxID=2949664 RepID=A0ABY5DP70_9ACTN|nr:SDR family NAD(P)-dependent oxidoreductase [Paraconexibacter antarcticus]UTI63833.1 SDR family NAD(P)-dependent oxidoreductase [Paraconexibacter antarcticus]